MTIQSKMCLIEEMIFEISVLWGDEEEELIRINFKGKEFEYNIDTHEGSLIYNYYLWSHPCYLLEEDKTTEDYRKYLKSRRYVKSLLKEINNEG